MPDLVTLYVSFLIFIIGLCIGSFLNVVILRGLSSESIVFPPSKCPKCNHRLKWWHNIPLISYILLKGKCYFCNEKISIQYFFVELLTGLTFLAVFYKFGYTLQTLVCFGIFSMFIIMTVTDLKEKVIFDIHSIILGILGILLSILNHTLINSILGILEGVLIMELLAAVGYLFVKSRAFGVGDTFIAAALGAIFGWQPLLTVLLLSLLLQAALTIPLFVKKLYKQKDFATITSLVTFLIIAITYRYATINLALNIYVIYLGVILVVISGLTTAKRIMGGVKNISDTIMLPFGPAMFVAAAIGIFITF